MLLGVTQGVLSSFWARPISFKVTPKGADGHRSLPLVTLLPYGLLAALAIGAVVSLHRVYYAQGYYWLALVNGGFYVVAVAVILAGFYHRFGQGVGQAISKR